MASDSGERPPPQVEAVERLTEQPGGRVSPTLRAMFDATSDAIIVSDPDFRVVDVNRAAELLYGWRKADLIGKTIPEVIPTTYLDDTPESVVEVFRRQGAWSGDVIQRSRHGRSLLMTVRVDLVRDEDGQPVAIVAINRDVTESRRTRAARELVQDLARVMVTAPAGRTRGRATEVLCAALGSRRGLVCVVDHAGDLVCSTNDGRSFVWPRDSWPSVLPDHTVFVDLGRIASVPDPASAIGPAIATPVGGQAGRIGHLVFASPDGSDEPPEHMLDLLVEAAAQLAPILRAQRQRDRQMRERTMLTEQMRQSQRLEAMGRLAGGIAHDFSNLLTIIANHADLGLRLSSADSAERAHLEAVSRAADRAMALTTQLVAFTRKPSSAQHGSVDLVTAVRELEPLMQRLIGEDVVVGAILPPGELWVRVQRSAIDQILLNLAANARDAMPDGGELTIEVGSVPAPSHLRVAGDAARLVVADNGRGMSREVAARVFEPFYTTKGPAGTGLGLFTVYGIVQQHRGHVDLFTEPGRGARFEVWLPLVEPPCPEGTSPAPVGALASGGRILLVEDEDDLREVLASALRQAGYHVVPVGGHHEALGQVHVPFDLVVADVVMPDGSGPAVVARYQAEQSGIRALFMSGHAGDAIERYGLDPSIPLIDKPFMVNELLEAIEAVLE